MPNVMSELLPCAQEAQPSPESSPKCPATHGGRSSTNNPEQLSTLGSTRHLLTVGGISQPIPPPQTPLLQA